MYIGWATKCASTPLTVMWSVEMTDAKLADVMLPSEVVMPVLKVTLLPL